MISGRTQVFALVGHPVGHSLSPWLHARMIDEAGADAVYVALPVDPNVAASVGPAIRALGLAGANLTVPFKQAILGQLDTISPEAAAVGAVNTVVRRPDGLWGTNTDAQGFVDGLHAEHGEVLRGARVGVLGAGGAAAAVAHGAWAAGARSVTVFARSSARAAALVARAPAGCVGEAAAWPEAVSGCDVLVQTASGDGARAVVNLDGLPADAVVVDLNYWLDDPPLLAAAAARGLRTQDGLPMLVHQAAGAAGWFYGGRPDAAALLSAARLTFAADRA